MSGSAFRYVPIRNLVYLAFEALLIVLFVMIELSAVRSNSNFSLGEVLLIPFICQICFYYGGAFGMNPYLPQRAFLIKNVQAVAASSAVLLALYTILPTTVVSRELFLVNLFLLPAILLVARMAYRKAVEGGRLDRPILIIGSGSIATLIRNEISASSHGYRIASGFDGSDPATLEGIAERVREYGIEKIIVAVTDRRGHCPLDALLHLKVRGVEVLDGVAFYEQIKGKILVEPLKPGWLIFGDGFRRPLTTRVIKRVLDRALALAGLVLVLPIVLVVPLLIKLDSEGPVFFRQRRVGENGKEFWLLKFRSMMPNAEARTGPIWARENDSRATRVGAVLRLLRIDEIPQMLNVLKGEMSFVGPRPERPVFVERLRGTIPYYDLRLSVKPGITGWAQVQYRYGASEEDAVEKLQYDLYYIKNLSLLLDLTILVKTVRVVLAGKGAR